jgi:hypothetical protein
MLSHRQPYILLINLFYNSHNTPCLFYNKFFIESSCQLFICLEILIAQPVVKLTKPLSTKETSSVKTTYSADCYREYKPRKSFAKLVREVDEQVEGLEGTAEEGRDIFIQLSNVKFKDWDTIERELSSYSLAKRCRFTLEESELLLHIRYMSSAIHECIAGSFDGALTEKVDLRIAPERWA